MADGLKKWNELLERLAEIGEFEAKVGIQGADASQKHDGEGELTTVEIASIHEYHGPNDSPPGRSFIRPPLYENEEHWKMRLAKMMRDFIAKGGNVSRAYRVVGEELRTAILTRMSTGIPPPLAESTIRARNRRSKGGAEDTTPLIDSGTMRGAISVVVGKR